MRKKLVHDRSPWKYEIYSWTRYQLCYRVWYKNKCTPDHQAKLFDTLLHILLLIFCRDHFFDSKERYRKKVNRKTLQWTREGMLLWRKTWCPLGLSKKKWFKTFRYFRWVLKSVSAIKVSGQQNYCKPNETYSKYVLKRVSFGSKDCTKELKLECAYFLGQTS